MVFYLKWEASFAPIFFHFKHNEWIELIKFANNSERSIFQTFWKANSCTDYLFTLVSRIIVSTRLFNRKFFSSQHGVIKDHTLIIFWRKIPANMEIYRIFCWCIYKEKHFLSFQVSSYLHTYEKKNVVFHLKAGQKL